MHPPRTAHHGWFPCQAAHSAILAEPLVMHGLSALEGGSSRQSAADDWLPPGNVPESQEEPDCWEALRTEAATRARE
eukprot:337334-Amphidinium_carterae.1